MMQKIFRLHEDVINQIAAGEVVENPASIVKELIENSLDAGASRIEVEIQGGGQQFIRVEDDGCGMGRADALLCIERHATSKIRTADDLSRLKTMGFRGEALAAIAAVSQFELKTSNGAESTRLTATGGNPTAPEPCARNRGTTIEIRSLFFNVPARLKFQKSASANGSQVHRILETISLAHPEVAFTFTANGKKLLQAEKSGQKERVEEILETLYEHEVCTERGGIGMTGFLASPQSAALTRTGQYLFINQRPIFSPLIARAVKMGFGTKIPEHAYPAFVLFLQVPSDAVDVNVHPQKKEVRFQDEGRIFRIVTEAVASAFSESFSFPTSLSFTPPPFSFAEPSPLPWDQPPTLQDAPVLDFVFPEKLLTVFGNYLLVQREKLLLIDLRALQSRILFESLKKENLSCQALLLPLEIELDPEDESIVNELNEMGIECRLIGPKKGAIDALPQGLEETDFPHFLAAWKEGKKLETAVGRCCRAGKKNYSMDSAAALWKNHVLCKEPFFDPQGNPIFVEISEADFERILKAKPHLKNS